MKLISRLSLTETVHLLDKFFLTVESVTKAL